jgi:hypothetical protein
VLRTQPIPFSQRSLLDMMTDDDEIVTHTVLDESVGLLVRREILAVRLPSIPVILHSSDIGQRFEAECGGQLFGAVVPAWLAEHRYPTP